MGATSRPSLSETSKSPSKKSSSVMYRHHHMSLFLSSILFRTDSRSRKRSSLATFNHHVVCGDWSFHL